MVAKELGCGPLGPQKSGLSTKLAAAQGAGTGSTGGWGGGAGQCN